MLFLSAQDFASYYLWQINVCLSNLNSKNISKEKIHVLFATHTGQKFFPEDQVLLRQIQKNARVFYYEDNRKDKVILRL